eukprot:TRINITY_DN2118_c0_g1_i3.p1 TRINITY_DN2118_c0_g1~~TRINITY_DN2118_c0_g1_i3.p1  ORF type:complete len:448 (+),score=76.61 TRINITY_DN2118_c0_g1_i3:38-1345(+)
MGEQLRREVLSWTMGSQWHMTATREEQVARMMRSFPGDASIQVWAARAITVLTADEPYAISDSAVVRSLGQAGACSALVSALVKHCPNATVQIAGLQAVSTLKSATNCGIFHDAGIGAALVAAMRTHAAHTLIQVEACMAMASLTSAAGVPATDCAFQLVRAGATDALIAPVRAHVQHATVLYHALNALGALAVHRFRPADVTLSLGHHAAQVVQAVVAAMRIDATHQGLQAGAAKAITRITEHNICGGAAIAQQFLDAGAGDALMGALAVSTRDGAAAPVLLALAALASHGGSAAQLLAAGAAEAIMAAVAKHCRGRSKSPCEDSWRAAVLSAATSAIAALASSAPADSARLSTAGACKVVVSAVLRFNNMYKANDAYCFYLRSGLKALAALAAPGESHSQAVASRLVQAGACEVATAVLRAVLRNSLLAVVNC